MIEKPIPTCSKGSCNDCDIHSRIACHFTRGQLFRFYLFVLPSFIIGGTGIYYVSMTGFIAWLTITGLFFLLIEIRVLCTHCPHYNESTDSLRCWANYGVPKLWKYRPGPMNGFEKAILVSGFIIVWGFPVAFISLTEHWILLGGYFFSVVLFFILLRQYQCKKCMNFSCPMNAVDNEIRKEFLNNNPLIRDSWKHKI